MHWGSINEFWSMGGYGLYVWGSYFVTLAILAIEVFLLRKSRNQTLKLLKRMRSFENES